MDTLALDDSESASYGKSVRRVRKKATGKMEGVVEDGESGGEMTKSEIRMTNECRMTNDE